MTVAMISVETKNPSGSVKRTALILFESSSRGIVSYSFLSFSFAFLPKLLVATSLADVSSTKRNARITLGRLFAPNERSKLLDVHASRGSKTEHDAF